MVYVGDGDDSVAGLAGVRRFSDQLDRPGLILVEANHFDLHPAVHIAAELYVCSCLVGVTMSADSQNDFTSNYNLIHTSGSAQLGDWGVVSV